MDKGYSIGGIQQIGVGVADINARWKEMSANFGFDTVIFRDRAKAALMTPYTKGIAEEREAMLALNLYGGGGLEIWQYISRTPTRNDTRLLPGTPGIYAACLRVPDVTAAHHYLEKLDTVSCAPMRQDDSGKSYFFCRDTDENLFQISEGSATLYEKLHPIGGVGGVIIGCRNIDSSLPLYRDLLGYDEVISDTTRTFTNNSFFLQPCIADGPAPPTTLNKSVSVRALLLRQSKRESSSPFSEFYGESTIELWQLLPKGAPPNSHAFHERQWGDIGFMHLCFEVTGMDALKKRAKKLGVNVTVDSKDSFGMGAAGGRFAYVEDADGTLIEFVETHRVRLLKFPPISLNVGKRTEPVSRKMLRALILKRSRTPR